MRTNTFNIDEYRSIVRLADYFGLVADLTKKYNNYVIRVDEDYAWFNGIEPINFTFYKYDNGRVVIRVKVRTYNGEVCQYPLNRTSKARQESGDSGKYGFKNFDVAVCYLRDYLSKRIGPHPFAA